MGTFLGTLSDLIWSAPVTAALFLVYFEISRCARFPQRRIFRAFFSRAGRKDGAAALGIHLSAVLGVGNIVGMAAAITIGGPGAVFWVFVSGLLGAGVQYAEALVCLKHPEGGKTGAMYALRACGMRKTAEVYALACALCGLFIGAAIPSGAAVQLALPSLDAGGRLLAGGVLCALSACALTGGMQRVQKICTRLVPPLLFCYLLILAGILYTARASVLPAIARILREAFALRPALSGAAGWGISRAMHWGCARGLFSSEAGLGTAGIAAQEMRGGSIHQRALTSGSSAVIDTVLLASLTGIAFVAAALDTGVGFGDAQALLYAAFSLFPFVGALFLRICVTILAFSTIMGWYWISCQAVGYFRFRQGRRLLLVLWLSAILAGPVLLCRALWDACDVVTVFLLAPNLALLLRNRHSLAPAQEKQEHGGTCT